MKKLRIGIIGAGASRAAAFGRNLSKREDVEITAISDINTKRLEAFSKNFNLDNVFKTNNYKEIIDKIDAAIVTTPDFTHKDIVIELLNSGVDVYCEKPMATSINDAKEIVDAHEKSGRLLFVGFNMRFTWVFKTVKNIVDSEIIGKVFTISQTEILDSYHTGSYYRRWHRKKEKSGDMILTKSCHDLDMITWLAGSKPKKVFGTAKRVFFTSDKKKADYCSICPIKSNCPFVYEQSNYNLSFEEKNNPTKFGLDLCVFNDDSDINDLYKAIISYENGIQAVYELIPLSNRETRLVYIVGEKGDIKVDAEEQKITVNIFGDKSIQEYKLDLETDSHGGSDPLILDEFIRTLKGENVTKVDGIDGLIATALAESIRISAETGEAVDFKI
ncbi:MAG: Gfo/Idh/MocA family protein [Thermoanaerobacteraceae bacterium]